jgi:RND family efflux transporter MFP subunit
VTPHTRMVAARAALITAGLWATLAFASAPGSESAFPHVVVAPTGSADRAAYDGVVEAVRQTVIAAQVSGAIVALDVKVGDRIKAGQTIARIDARAAEQTTAASDAQVQAARAALEVASKDVERQRLLFQKRFISAAALDRAEAEFKSTQAHVNAQLAQAAVARTQTGFFVVRAPYAGIVSEVPVNLGDMAMPGRAIATVYDAAALRVAASIPQTAVPRALTSREIMIDVAGDGEPARIEPVRVTVLPTVDPASHTVTIRLDLPPGRDLRPGLFARTWIPAPPGSTDGRITIPVSAIVRRAELTAVYVLNEEDRPLLRQVRLGRSAGEQVEVLAGVSAGDRVVTAPQAAARASVAMKQVASQ